MLESAACCWMRTEMRRSSSIAVSRSARNNRPRFINRTGTVSPIALRTRTPVVCAMASSRALLLFGLESGVGVVALLLPLRVMDEELGIGAHAFGFALLGAFGDDGLGRELARLELRALGVLFRSRFLIADRGVLVARQNRAAFLLSAVSRADLDYFRSGGNGLGHVRCEFRLVATRIDALCGIWANCKSFLLAPRRANCMRRRAGLSELCPSCPFDLLRRVLANRIPLPSSHRVEPNRRACLARSHLSYRASLHVQLAI